MTVFFLVSYLRQYRPDNALFYLVSKYEDQTFVIVRRIKADDCYIALIVSPEEHREIEFYVAAKKEGKLPPLKLTFTDNYIQTLRDIVCKQEFNDVVYEIESPDGVDAISEEIAENVKHIWFLIRSRYEVNFSYRSCPLYIQVKYQDITKTVAITSREKNEITDVLIKEFNIN